MSYEVRNARRAPQDTFEARNTMERGEVFRPYGTGFSTVVVLQAYCDVNNIELDHASTYGEPGYSDPDKGILFSNWNHVPKTLQDRLEAQGYSLEWSDEWYIDYDYGKAYRTSPDSYGWQSQIMYSEATGDYLTPDSDVSDWIAQCEGNARTALPSWIAADDIAAAGFAQTSDEYENGFHPGQTDDPKAIAAKLSEAGKSYVFQISDVGQFDVHFVVWVKSQEDQS